MTDVVIWLEDLFDDHGQVRVGGVQTYVLELVEVFASLADRVFIATERPGDLEEMDSIPQAEVIPLVRSEWRRGVAGSRAGDLGWQSDTTVHIVANSNRWPRPLGKRNLAIQHGIYWDRPANSHGWKRLIPRTVQNTWRAWRGANTLRQGSQLVCVDLAFPTAAATLRSPLPWQQIHYIPNFAPAPETPPAFHAKVKRIVFPRRFEVHRGTRLFAQAIVPILEAGWDGQVDLVGVGADEPWLRAQLAHYPNVSMRTLPFSARMQAYSDDAVVVIPTLSTEGTSLACLEAWSRGALVVATGVGGLANLVLDGVNGCLIRPLADELRQTLEAILAGKRDTARLRKCGYETWQHGFSRDLWRCRWQAVVRPWFEPAAGKGSRSSKFNAIHQVGGEVRELGEVGELNDKLNHDLHEEPTNTKVTRML